jgi:hypothetical protein
MVVCDMRVWGYWEVVGIFDPLSGKWFFVLSAKEARGGPAGPRSKDFAKSVKTVQ